VIQYIGRSLLVTRLKGLNGWFCFVGRAEDDDGAGLYILPTSWCSSD